MYCYRYEYMLLLVSVFFVDGLYAGSDVLTSKERLEIAECVDSSISALRVRKEVNSKEVGHRKKSYKCIETTQTSAPDGYYFIDGTQKANLTGFKHRHDIYPNLKKKFQESKGLDILECTYCAGGNQSGTERGYVKGYCSATAEYRETEVSIVRIKQNCFHTTK